MDDLKSFVIEGQRKRGMRKSILIIDPKKIPEFFEAFDKSDCSDVLKAFIGVCLAGGCRGAEVHSLQRKHVIDGRIEDLKVLKKREDFTSKTTGKILKAQKVYRSFDLHPTTPKYLAKLCVGKRRFEKLFDLSLSAIYRQIVAIFGEGFCIHSLRHSHISYRLHVKKQSVQEVEDRIKISISTISTYSHLNTKEKEGIWD